MVAGLATEATNRRTKTVRRRMCRAAVFALPLCRLFNDLRPFVLMVAWFTTETTNRRAKSLCCLCRSTLSALPFRRCHCRAPFLQTLYARMQLKRSFTNYFNILCIFVLVFNHFLCFRFWRRINKGACLRPRRSVVWIFQGNIIPCHFYHHTFINMFASNCADLYAHLLDVGGSCLRLEAEHPLLHCVLICSRNIYIDRELASF